MTYNEIINVLEICVNKTDVFVIHHNAETREYDKISIKDILGVINRQKAEIENYKQIAENQQTVSMDKEFEIRKLNAEVERLEKENQLLLDKHPANTHRNCVIIDNGIIYTKTINDYDKFLTAVSNEAVKEFAERLKARKYQSSEWSHGGHPFVVEEDDIDEILEEMVGEDK